MSFVPTSLLQAAAQPSLLEAFLPMAIVFGIFYVLVIGPSKKKQERQDALLKNLKAGDKVVLSSGIFGVVEGLEGEVAYVRVADKTRLKVQRTAIGALEAPETEKK
jgi:preprotein translocase subunit YajC